MKTPIFIALLAVAAALPACGGQASDVCAEFCDNCGSCNSRDRDECEIEVQASIDVASDYGCDQEISDLYDCAIRKYRCNSGHVSLDPKDCDSQSSDLSDCEAKGSHLD